MVRVEGLEPPRPCGHQILSLARLPIPPHPHFAVYSPNLSAIQIIAVGNRIEVLAKKLNGAGILKI